MKIEENKRWCELAVRAIERQAPTDRAVAKLLSFTYILAIYPQPCSLLLFPFFLTLVRPNGPRQSYQDLLQ